jgi:hypothetical protein
METDPFVVESDRATVRQHPHPAELDDVSGDGYERNAVEGAYSIEIAGRTEGRGWQVSFFVFKSAYVQAATRSRGRSRHEYVSYELTSGSAPTFAGILHDEADANGFTGKREKGEFVIDFVQRLPYVPDDVSKGFDDYTKFLTETLAELGGDWADTAIMLASLLEAEPFNYDMVLIQPPSHMAAGIWRQDPRGYYWEYDGRKYAYVETTGEGWYRRPPRGLPERDHLRPPGLSHGRGRDPSLPGLSNPAPSRFRYRLPVVPRRVVVEAEFAPTLRALASGVDLALREHLLAAVAVEHLLALALRHGLVGGFDVLARHVSPYHAVLLIYYHWIVCNSNESNATIYADRAIERSPENVTPVTLAEM